MTSPKLVPLGTLVEDVATWNPAGAPSRETFQYIDLSAVDQELKAVVGAREVACTEAPSRARQLVQSGDVLVSTVRPNLNGVAKVSNEFDAATASTGFCVLRPKPSQMCGNYLFHWVRSPKFVADMVSKVTGASYPAVSDRIVKESSIPHVPLSEQRRIAAILDQADALRAKRREALAQLDSLAQSIFLDTYGDLTANPKGFPVRALGEVCDVRDGTHDSPKFWPEGCPLVTTKNLREGVIDFSEVNFISEDDYVAINRRSKVDKGDILMPMIGTIGNPVLVEIEPNFAIKNMALIKFTEKSPDRQFVLRYLESECFKRLVAKKNKGGTQKFLALGEIRSLPIQIPPHDLQKKFASLMLRIQSHVAQNTRSLLELDALFASLQHRAFRGKL